MSNINNIITVIVYIWVGFVGAISFMEAWLKFRAEGVTRSIGLSIGRLVFFSLNKVEIIFVFLILVLVYFLKKNKFSISHLNVLIIPILIVVFQTLYLLPILDKRAKLIIDGEILPSSNFHILYVILEVIKISTLFWVGIRTLNIK